MANLTITLKTQAVNSFGPAPSQKWGTAAAMVWGTSPWGQKVAGQGHAPSIIEDITKVWTGNNSVASTMPLIFNSTRFWTGSNTITVIYQPQDVESLTGNGYNLVFVDRTINDMSAAVNAYTSQAAGSFTWISQVAGTTTWS